MKTPHKASHSYDQLRGMVGTSEDVHLKEINRLNSKFTPEVYKKTKEEKEELKKAMYNHPSKKHAPDNRIFNASITSLKIAA